MARHVLKRTALSRTRLIFGICAVLAVITWLIFGQTLEHQFVTYDDPNYVYENANITAGVWLQGLIWAFTHNVGGNWHLLTTFSHMGDCQLSALTPAAHLLLNILL